MSEPLLGVLYCHCKRCQRRTGSGFSVSAFTAPGSYRTVSGEDLVRTWTPSGGGWVKGFCAECGSQLFTTNPDNPELIAVRVGALDEDPGALSGARQFTAFAPPWSPIPDDGLPRFPERPGS